MFGDVFQCVCYLLLVGADCRNKAFHNAMDVDIWPKCAAFFADACDLEHKRPVAFVTSADDWCFSDSN